MIRVVAGLCLAAALGAAACEADHAPDLIMAPSSFAPVIDDIDRALEAEGQVPPEWIVAGSQRLVAQLADGAEAQLLITADQVTMDGAIRQGLVETAMGVVARNRLVLAFAPGNPGAVDDLTDLEDESLLIGVCASAVPCGRLSLEAALSLGLELAADTEEPSVLSLAQKIARGELDAGLVYATDAVNFGLDTVDDDRLAPFVTEYPAASIDGSTVAVVNFLRSDDGRAILAAAGFEVP